VVQFLAFIVIVLAVFVIYKAAVLLLDRQVSLGFRRAAYAVTAFWIGLPFVVILAQSGWDISEVGHEAWIAWVLLAVLPNVLFWTLIWVLSGFGSQINRK